MKPWSCCSLVVVVAVVVVIVVVMVIRMLAAEAASTFRGGWHPSLATPSDPAVDCRNHQWACVKERWCHRLRINSVLHAYTYAPSRLF